MRTNTVSTSGTNLGVIALGILAALLVAAVYTERKIPLLSSDRAAVVALVAIGMAICAQGIGRVAAAGAWTHPFSILAYLLGGAILLVGIAALAGKQVPPLSSYAQSFTAVTILAVAKVVLTAIHRLFL